MRLVSGFARCAPHSVKSASDAQQGDALELKAGCAEKRNPFGVFEKRYRLVPLRVVECVSNNAKLRTLISDDVVIGRLYTSYER